MAASQKKTRINVEVTERDIERAHKNDSYTCIVSQAIARTVTDATRIETDVQLIRFTRGGVRYGYLTPYAVQGYVVAFDAGDPIQPFSFQLRDPRILRRTVNTEAGKAIDRARTRQKRAEASPAPPAPPEGRGGKPPVAASKKAATGAPQAGELEAVKAAYAAAQKSRTVAGGSDARRAPPRVFKKKTRMYGHRLLRINQEAARPAGDEQ
jgi:hypothetical protein